MRLLQNMVPQLSKVAVVVEPGQPVCRHAIGKDPRSRERAPDDYMYNAPARSSTQNRLFCHYNREGQWTTRLRLIRFLLIIAPKLLL